MKTKTYRNRSGWNVATTIELAGNREMRIATSRARRGQLCTIVSVTKLNGDGTQTFVISSAGRGDYSKTWAVSVPRRVTETVAIRQHDAVLERLAEIKAEVEAYYAAHDQCSTEALQA